MFDSEKPNKMTDQEYARFRMRSHLRTRRILENLEKLDETLEDHEYTLLAFLDNGKVHDLEMPPTSYEHVNKYVSVSVPASVENTYARLDEVTYLRDKKGSVAIAPGENPDKKEEFCKLPRCLALIPMPLPMTELLN